MWEPRERGQRAVNRDLPPGAEISDLASQLSLCNASSPQSLPAGDQARQPKAAPAEHRFLEEETEQQQQQPLASPLLPMPTASLRWETEAKAEASEKARGRGGPGPRGGRGRASPPPGPGRAAGAVPSAPPAPGPENRPGAQSQARGGGGGLKTRLEGGSEPRPDTRHSPPRQPPLRHAAPCMSRWARTHPPALRGWYMGQGFFLVWFFVFWVFFNLFSRVCT